MPDPKPPLPLHAPPGDTTVKVSVIDSTMWLVGITCNQMWNPPIKGFDRVKAGTWSSTLQAASCSTTWAAAKTGRVCRLHSVLRHCMRTASCRHSR